jgi:hypothetical protein
MYRIYNENASAKSLVKPTRSILDGMATEEEEKTDSTQSMDSDTSSVGGTAPSGALQYLLQQQKHSEKVLKLEQSMASLRSFSTHQDEEEDSTANQENGEMGSSEIKWIPQPESDGEGSSQLLYASPEQLFQESYGNNDDGDEPPELMGEDSEQPDDMPALEDEPPAVAAAPQQQPQPVFVVDRAAAPSNADSNTPAARRRPSRTKSADIATLHQQSSTKAVAMMDDSSNNNSSTSTMAVAMMDDSSNNNSNNSNDSGMDDSSSRQRRRRTRPSVPKRSKTTHERAGTSTRIGRLPKRLSSRTKANSNSNKVVAASRSVRRAQTVDERMTSSPDTKSSSLERRRRKSTTDGGTTSATSAITATRSLRRTRTVDERIPSSSSSPTKSSSPLERMRRKSSTDGTTATAAAAAPVRRSLRRNRTVDERLGGGTTTTPRRTSSIVAGGSGGVLARVLPLRTRSGSGRRGKRTSVTPTTHMNIFGSDLVSTDFILKELDTVATTTDIVSLELEDCLVAANPKSTAIPTKLRTILAEDSRPWEGIRFVDDVTVTTLREYKDWKQRRKQFLKQLGGICEQKIIPVQHTVKMRVTDSPVAEDDDRTTASNNISSSSFHSRSKMVHEFVQCLREFQKDKHITHLSVRTDHTTLELIHAVIDLLQCDDRTWHAMTLHLSGSGPVVAGSNDDDMEDDDDALDPKAWQEQMHIATMELQRIAKQRGIRSLA